MRKAIPTFLISYLVCTGLLGGTARAEIIGLPTVSITSASGQVQWGPTGNVTASLSGPDFTLSFSDVYPSSFIGDVVYAFGAKAGQPFVPDEYLYSTEAKVTFVPDGTLAVGGATYGVAYSENPYIIGVVLSTPTTVPSGSATLTIPAILEAPSGFSACELRLPSLPCNLQPNSAFVANVDFAVPGILTVSFVPAENVLYPDNGFNEQVFTATFTPVPEPSTAWLIFAGFALAGGTRLWHSPRHAPYP